MSNDPVATCKMCGVCCSRFQNPTVPVNIRDIKRYITTGRHDILKHVMFYQINPGVFGVQNKMKCPFLRALPGGRFGCGINDVKPEICVEYQCTSCQTCGGVNPGDRRQVGTHRCESVWHDGQ
jgi:Fe-S-cluster containining protein